MLVRKNDQRVEFTTGPLLSCHVWNVSFSNIILNWSLLCSQCFWRFSPKGFSSFPTASANAWQKSKRLVGATGLRQTICVSSLLVDIYDGQSDSVKWPATVWVLESICLDLYVDSMINDPISSMQSDSYPTHLLIHVDLFILLFNVAAMFYKLSQLYYT